MSSTVQRGKPSQARAQRRRQRICDGAESLFAERGFERTTSRDIAARADVSVGSLYQFFASKEAILEAIAEGYLSQSRELVSGLLSSSATMETAELLDVMIGQLVQLQERRPYFLQCLSLAQPWCVLNAAVARFQDAMVSEVARVLEMREVSHDTKVLRLKARICVDTMSALLPIVVYARGRERTRASQEVNGLLCRYLSDGKVRN